MNKLAEEILSVVVAADMIGAEDSQFGDAIEIIADCIEQFGERNKYIFSDRLQNSLRYGAEKFDDPSAIEFLLDVEICRKEFISNIGS